MSLAIGSGAALPGTYAVVRALVADLSPGLILDAPCGEGLLANLLGKAGHRVVAADLDPTKSAHLHIPTVGLDLNVRLPFQNGSFDAVVSIEGVEHLENPYMPLREFFRVLRPAGVLIVSTPNILNLRSRVKFLTLGTFFWFDEAGYRRGFHVNALPLYEMRYILSEAGFAVEEVRVNRRVPGMRIAAAALGPALRMAARVRGRSGSLNTPDLLSGEVLLIRARRPATL